MKIEEIAKAAHQVNKAYCESLGDTSQLDWDECPEWQRRSAILGVQLHTDNPEAGPEASHQSWMKEKVEDGWVYGEKKDPNATPPTHHCIVPFNELPKEQQAKDFIFRAVVHALN